MKISPRIIAPVLLAAICAGGLLAFLWWELTKSTAGIGGNILPTSQRIQTTNSIDHLPLDTEDTALLHLRQGEVYLLRGDLPDAEGAFENAVKEGGGLTALRKLASVQLQRRDIKATESTMKKMKSAGAKPEDILLLESIILLRTGELVEARSVLEAAQDSPQKHYSLALLAIIEGNHEAALQELEITAADWDPVLRSYARTIQAAYEEFALFPEGSDAHLITLLSRGLAQVQECELALPLLVQVTAREDSYRDAWIVQGYCELASERFTQALASLEHAYTIDPQKPEIQYFLARAYAALGEYQNAITFFEYALTNGFEPQSEVRRLIARYALEIGNAALALDQYKAMTELPDASIESFEGYITAALALGKPSEAQLKAAEAVEKWPEDARAYVLLGTVAAELGNTDDAKAAFEKALSINPNVPGIAEKLNAL